MAEICHKSRFQACGCSSRKVDAEHTYKSCEQGERETVDYRIFFQNATGAQVSPWHSIPLFTESGLLNMVCEIPRNTRAKFEVSTSELGNPIKQDMKKGKLRYYGIDMKWNYGMFPQTWEDPTHASEDCGGCVGDNDPVDVVEVGEHDPSTGSVYAVKPIAALAMIDEGELDWKVVAISAADPRCDMVNDVTDMELHFPGTLDAIREWFRTYKTHEGKPENKFELNEAFVGRAYTMDVVWQTHGFWKQLILQSKSQEASVKVAVGDFPIVTACFEGREEDTSSEIADTMKMVMEAVHEQEEHALHHIPVSVS